MAELEPTIQPIADRLELAGKMGLSVTLEPDAARAAGQALRLLARYGDRHDALRRARRELGAEALKTLLWITPFAVALAWWNS